MNHKILRTGFNGGAVLPSQVGNLQLLRGYSNPEILKNAG